MQSEHDELIHVMYPSGRRAPSVHADEARQMLRAGVAEPVGGSRSFRMIVLIEGPSRPVAGTRYSSCHGTNTNPQNVWQLRRMAPSTQHIFQQSLYDATPGGRERYQALEPAKVATS